MKTKILVLTLVLMLVGTCIPTMAALPKGENLMTNGSFENELTGIPTGWKFCKGVSGEPALANATGEIVTDMKTEGNNGFHMVAAAGERAIFRQFLPAGTLTVGKQYQISACINIVSGTGARFAVRNGDVYNGTALCDLITGTNVLSEGTTDGWMRLSRAFTYKDANTEGCSFIVDTNGQAVELYIDDIRICETDIGILEDDGEFEYFNTDFSNLEINALQKWLARSNATLPGDTSLVRTEDYGTALRFKGKGGTLPCSNVKIRFDDTKLNALAADTTIKVTFRMKVEKAEPTQPHKVSVMFHKGPSPTPGRFNEAFEIPVAYYNKWVLVEHWYSLRAVSNKDLYIYPGVLSEDTYIWIDGITAHVVDTAEVATGKTLSLVQDEKTPNGGDEYSSIAPTAFVSTRVSVDESYKVGETATIYVHYPTKNETAQKGVVINTVYSTKNGIKTMELVKINNISAVVRGKCGEGLPFDLSGITLDSTKQYTVESFMWDSMSGFLPLDGSKKAVVTVEAGE